MAFTEVSTHGGFRDDPEVYAAQVERWRTCGGFVGACSQDYMCEPFVLAKTGLTVRRHQELTIERYVRIRAATQGRIIPVLQGFLPSEYVDHLHMYGDRGLLSMGLRIGVGSVCKRNARPEQVEDVLTRIKNESRGLLLHGLGIKITALQSRVVRDCLYSADSMAWSSRARHAKRDAMKLHGLNHEGMKRAGLFTPEMDVNNWRNAKRFEERITGQNVRPSNYQQKLAV